MSMISAVTTLTYGILLVSIGLAVWRLLRGPSLADRVMAIDFLALAAIGFIAVSSLENGQYAYLDVAIATALVAFLATVAFARYVLQRSSLSADAPPASRSSAAAPPPTPKAMTKQEDQSDDL